MAGRGNLQITVNMATKNKPCPYCFGEGGYYLVRGHSKALHTWVECPKCKGKGITQKKKVKK